jgi:hypothetical protein
MLKSPPMFPTPMTPEDIIGRSNMPLFKKFYSIAASSTNSGEFPDKRLNKEIGADDRKAIAETLQHLRDHGFYPNGSDKNKNIVWGTMLKSQSQIEMEKGLGELNGLPEKQLQDMARRGYLMAVKSVGVGPISEAEGIYEETVSG